jgi:hypothetical protein
MAWNHFINSIVAWDRQLIALWYRSVISNSERQRLKAIGLWLSTASLKRCPDTNLILLDASAGMLEQTGTAAL